jgi:hypothetical protein
MQNQPGMFLILNGLIGLMIGFLCGAPLGRAIAGRKHDDVVRAWRVAHSSLVSGGIMLLAIASVLPDLQLTVGVQWAVSIALSLSLYAFSYALVFGSWQGHRGLNRSRSVAAMSVYYGNMAGVVLSMIPLCVLIYGAARAAIG